MEKCHFPKCRKPPCLVYIGRDVCEDHWGRLCKVDSETEKMMLGKIGLIRNKNGTVVEVVNEKNN